MAIFNTLEGGYYGKLGQTVGQRWKNIRTLRTYVIPHNPRTPIQQANRNRFGGCVPYAQLAMAMNKKTTAFDTSSLTLWNCRMSAARALQNSGQTEMNLIPLYPQGFSVPYTISAANITEIVDSTHFKVTVEGNLPESERVLMLLLMADGEENWLDRLYLCKGQNSSADYNTFTMTIPEPPPSWENMQGRFVSCDDTDSATDLIGSGQIAVQLATVDEHEFDTTVTNIQRDSSQFIFTFAENYRNGSNVVENVSLSCVVRGAVVSLAVDEPALINNGGKFAIAVPFSASDGADIPALPSGSYLSIGSISSTSSLVIATAENVTAAAVDTSDLVRDFNSITSVYSRFGSPFAQFSLAATPTLSSTAAVTMEMKHNPNIYWVTENLSLAPSVSGNNILIPLFDSSIGIQPAFVGSYFKPSAEILATAGGVTYRIKTQEYAFDLSGFNAYVTTEVTSDLTNDELSVNFYLDSSEEVPSITAVTFNQSGRVGCQTSQGAYVAYGTYAGSLSGFTFDGTDGWIALSLSDVTVIEPDTMGDEFYPNPLQFTLTQGGKSFNIYVSCKGSGVNVDVA